MNRKGFTLIEMLVVIAIIALLSSVVVIGLTGARSKARDARRVADIREIQNALEINYVSATGYANALTDLDVYVTAPLDPQNEAYEYAKDGMGYLLGICLEGVENDTADTYCPGSSIEDCDYQFCVSPN